MSGPSSIIARLKLGTHKVAIALSAVTGLGHIYLRRYVQGVVLFALFAAAANGVLIGALWQGVRETLLDTFAVHHSESVQHTLHAMGRAVLDRFAEITAIRLVIPNRHHLPVDLTPFGLENRNEIFVATEEPFGVIEAMLVR